MGNLFITALVATLSWLGYIPPTWQVVAIGIPVGILLVFWVAVIILKLPNEAIYFFSDIYLEKQVTKWTITDAEGSFDSKDEYHYRKRRGYPIRGFEYYAGFFTDPRLSSKHPFTINVKILRPLHRKINVAVEPQYYERQITLPELYPSKLHAFYWTINVAPPVAKGECFSFTCSYATNATEKEAFREEGSISGLRVLHPTRVLEIVLDCSHPMSLVYLGHFVVSEEGEKVIIEKNRNPNPEFVKPSGPIVWKILHAKMHLRYCIAYKVITT